VKRKRESQLLTFQSEGELTKKGEVISTSSSSETDIKLSLGRRT